MMPESRVAAPTTEKEASQLARELFGVEGDRACLAGRIRRQFSIGCGGFARLRAENHASCAREIVRGYAMPRTGASGETRPAASVAKSDREFAR